jgi:hypothetical protein
MLTTHESTRETCRHRAVGEEESEAEAHEAATPSHAASLDEVEAMARLPRTTPTRSDRHKPSTLAAAALAAGAVGTWP